MKSSLELLLSRIIRYVMHLDRISLLWYGLLIWMSIILIWTFRYTVLDHAYFSSAAEKQQKAIIQNPVSR
jgi:prolipoprotein diacylglyceryltransferase